MTESDTPFFESIVADSPDWKRMELKEKNLSGFIKEWQDKGGWRIWSIEGECTGISFHIESAPSNGKPWLGTILVKKTMRQRGAARMIIQSLSEELQQKGYSVLFAGIPVSQSDWVDILSRCRFEQFKSETSGEETYLILIRPL